MNETTFTYSDGIGLEEEEEGVTNFAKCDGNEFVYISSWLLGLATILLGLFFLPLRWMVPSWMWP